jgi:phosphatidylglycerol:prolipoprotein diacylglycerol transferase
MIAYWVHNLDPFAFQFGNGFGVRWYGIAYLAAFAAAYFVYLHLAKRGFSVIPADKVGDFITGCAVFGVLIGGRLGHFLFYDRAALLVDPLVFFRVWEGGMSAHGGILGVVVYTLWYAWRHNVNWPGLGDNLVVGAPLGLLFGRLANFINGELYGRPASVPWAVKFPQEIYELPVEKQREILALAQNTIGEPAGLEQIVTTVSNSPDWRETLGAFLTPRHPSQIYEGLLEGLLLFVLLWILRTRVRTANGVITGAFFVGYAILRSIGEFFRAPEDGYVGFLTAGQFLSVFIFLIGIGFWVAAKLRPAYPPAER